MKLEKLRDKLEILLMVSIISAVFGICSVVVGCLCFIMIFKSSEIFAIILGIVCLILWIMLTLYGTVSFIDLLKED